MAHIHGKFYKGLEAEFSGLSPQTSVQFTNKNIIFDESIRNKNMDVYSRFFCKDLFDIS